MSHHQFKANRSLQEKFEELLSYGFDGYGYIEDDDLEKEFCIFIEDEEAEEHQHYFENDVFMIRPYFWGESQYIKSLPNFIHKPTGIELSWYKYPLRGVTCNREELTDELFIRIVDECIKSIADFKPLEKILTDEIEKKQKKWNNEVVTVMNDYMNHDVEMLGKWYNLNTKGE